MKIIITILFFVISQFACYSQNGATVNDSLLIAQKLEQMYGYYEGYNYLVWDIINVDSSKAQQDNFGKFNDPYNTLKGCYLFTSQYTFGIFKNNEIIWAYDQILPYDSPYGKISGTLDLNNDGMVEVLSEWVIPGDNHPGCELYIISWDGISGTAINGLSEYDSDIYTLGYGNFDIADIEGDGLWDIIGYGINTDEEAVLVPLIFKWDGVNYTLSEDLINTDNYFPRNKFSAVVKCKIIKENDSLYFYDYTIMNSDSSIQYINTVDIWGGVDSNSTIVSPEEWDGVVVGGAVSWEQQSGLLPLGFTLENKIKPGETKNNFRFSTTGLPKITSACLRGYNTPGSLEVESYSSIYDYLNNSVFIPTISAYKPPYPFIPSYFIDTLLSYIDQSSEINWIKNSVSDKYISFLDSAKKQLERGKLDSVSYILNVFLQEIIIDSSCNISPEAYNLFKYNIEYLLRNLESDQEFNYNLRIPGNSGSLFTGTDIQYYVKIPLAKEKAEYYAGAWRQFGTTINGEAVKELLPANLSFRASYNGMQKDKVQNTSGNSTVEFVLP